MDGIVNKVAQSGLVTIDLADLRAPGERVAFDIAQCLFQGLILREKDFREFIKSHNWSDYSGKVVTVTCSADAIVPTWAYMLLTIALQPHATRVFFGSPAETEAVLFTERIAQMDMLPFTGARVVVKGCGDSEIPVQAFVALATRLTPVAKSIMYGEPCSTVPLFKRK